MTVSEMHTAFRLQLDKSTSLVGNPDFLPEEIDYWLNEAQDRFIKQRMSGNNYLQKGFEQNKKRMDDLKYLISMHRNLTGLSTYAWYTNIKAGTLPVSDPTLPYMFYINSSVYDVSGNSLQTGDVVSHENINIYVKDNINSPYIRRPLVSFVAADQIIFIYGDEFIPVGFDVTYIRRPKKLVNGTPGTYETNTCELSLHTHPEIVVMAVDLVIENTENPRVQTFEPINTNKIE